MYIRDGKVFLLLGNDPEPVCIGKGSMAFIPQDTKVMVQNPYYEPARMVLYTISP